jgi:hypothetical protein
MSNQSFNSKNGPEHFSYGRMQLEGEQNEEEKPICL